MARICSDIVLVYQLDAARDEKYKEFLKEQQKLTSLQNGEPE